MKAKDLIKGQDFKLAGQRKFRTILDLLTDNNKNNSCTELQGKILILCDNGKEIILDHEQEVIINETDILLAERFLAQPQKESKEQAVERIFYQHEGFKFHPCAGLIYNLRWGKYIFDIRKIRELYGVKTKDISMTEILSSHTQKAFTTKIEEMLKMIGDEPFKNVLLKLS